MYLWIIAAVAAYFIKGLCGFANTLVFTSILSFSASNANISPIDLLLGYPTNLILTWKNRKSLDPKVYLPLAALVLAGSIPGALLLKNVDARAIKLVFGVVVAVFGVEMLSREYRKKKVRSSKLVLAIIGVTAGETEDPRRTIPKATNGIIWRILVFYIGALGVIMAVVPWNTLDGVTSPFVQIFDTVGVHAAAGILNFVCLTAVMSVYNSGLYSNSRMLYSLAQQGNAPAYLAKTSKRGVPVAGVLTSAAVTVVAVVVVFLWPEFAFNYLMSIATISAIINWSMIMVTQLKFRKKVAAGEGPNELAGRTGKEAVDAILFKLPLARVMPFVVLAFLAGHPAHRLPADPRQEAAVTAENEKKGQSLFLISPLELEIGGSLLFPFPLSKGSGSGARDAEREVATIPISRRLITQRGRPAGRPPQPMRTVS